MLDRTNVRGSAHREKITFEDARFSAPLNIRYCDLGDARLDCFQTVFDNTDVYITDSQLRDSEINLCDCKVRKVYFSGIDALPVCECNFKEAELLSIQHCSIQNALYVQNVLKFETADVSRLAPIISNDKWTITPWPPTQPKYFLNEYLTRHIRLL